MDRFSIPLQIISPKLCSGTTTVVLGVVVRHLETEAREIQKATCVIETGFVGIRDGKHPTCHRFRVDRGDDAVGTGACTILGADQHFALRRPTKNRDDVIFKTDTGR